jgi:translation initiation factor 1 (eIF-1/SUI1)
MIKLKRGGKKIITNVLGLDTFGCNLADVAKLMGKKFGSGAAALLIEYKGLSQDGIQIQGDIYERMEDFLAKDLAKYEIPFSCVTIEDGGNFKTR